MHKSEQHSVVQTNPRGCHHLEESRACPTWPHRDMRPCILQEEAVAWDFPSCPVVKTLQSQCMGCGFDPWSRSQDPTCLVAPKPKAIKQKQCCRKFDKDFQGKMIHVKKNVFLNNEDVHKGLLTTE